MEGQSRAATSIRGAIKRLSLHLPRELHAQVDRSLVIKKFAYPASLSNKESTNVDLKKLQAIVNDVARTVVGVRRMEWAPIEELLNLTSLTSLNRLSVERAAVETWKPASESIGCSLTTSSGRRGRPRPAC